MLNYSGKHELSFAHQGHYYIYKNMNLVSKYFHEIFINNQLLVDRVSCSIREGEKTSLAPELENLGLIADTRSETMYKLRISVISLTSWNLCEDWGNVNELLKLESIIYTNASYQSKA